MAKLASCRETSDELPDASKNGLLIAREGPVIGTIELDESRPRDVTGKMPAGADANGAVAATMEHEGRRGNSVQKFSGRHRP